MPGQQNAPAVYTVIIHRPGPNWQPGLDFTSQPHFAEHSAHCFNLFNNGKVLQGGPFTSGDGGMMVISPDEPLESLRKFIDSDPAVKAGVITGELHTWKVVAERQRKAE